jgi:hypothetical protein
MKAAHHQRPSLHIVEVDLGSCRADNPQGLSGDTLCVMSCEAWRWVVHVLSRHKKTLLVVGEQIGVQRCACHALMMHAATQK